MGCCMQSNTGSSQPGSANNQGQGNPANPPVNRNPASRPRGSGPRQGAP